MRTRKIFNRKDARLIPLLRGIFFLCFNGSQGNFLMICQMLRLHLDFILSDSKLTFLKGNHFAHCFPVEQILSHQDTMSKWGCFHFTRNVPICR